MGVVDCRVTYDAGESYTCVPASFAVVIWAPIRTVGKDSAPVGPACGSVSRCCEPELMSACLAPREGLLDTGSVRRVGPAAVVCEPMQVCNELANAAADAGRSSLVRARPLITADSSSALVDGALRRSG